MKNIALLKLTVNAISAKSIIFVPVFMQTQMQLYFFNKAIAQARQMAQSYQILVKK